MNPPGPTRRLTGFDLRVDPWIAGLSTADHRAAALARALRLDVHRPCAGCAQPCWIRRRELVWYDRAVPVLCARCVGDAFVELLPRRSRRC